MCEQRSWVRGAEEAIGHRTASVLVSAIERRREEGPSVPVAEADGGAEDELMKSLRAEGRGHGREVVMAWPWRGHGGRLTVVGGRGFGLGGGGGFGAVREPWRARRTGHGRGKLG